MTMLPLTEAEKALILGDDDPSPVGICPTCREPIYEPFIDHYDREHRRWQSEGRIDSPPGNWDNGGAG